jgi:MFS family permease
VTENDWVCELEIRATDLFTLGNVGLIVGTAVFSAFADFKGRRLAFYIATAFAIGFQLVQIGVSHIYPLFVLMKVNIKLISNYKYSPDIGGFHCRRSLSLYRYNKFNNFY